MPWQSKKSRESVAETDAEVIVYDDGGSGLFAACQERFGSLGFVIECDAKHTVWVKNADGSRSVGLAPWQLTRHSMEKVLDDVEERLGLTVRSH